MNKLFQSIFIVIFSILLGVFLIWVFNLSDGSYQVYEKASENQLKDFFYQQKISQSELQNKFRNGEKIKILVVPGHTDDFPGSIYRGVKEVTLNRIVANDLFNILKDDQRFEVEIFEMDNEVFKQTGDSEEIQEFKDGHQRLERLFKENNKDFVLNTNLYSDTEEEVIDTLYGINLWLNKNDYDIVIHVHFNNYDRVNKNQPGEFEGFSIYVPYHNYSNGIASQKLADQIFVSLGDVLTKSDLLQGDRKSIESDNLIALGAFNTLETASVLIEYGFIYEDKFLNGNKEIFHSAAQKTYEGILEFLK